MVKVFTPNKAGKIEFTKMELENLLNEVWLDGYNANRFYWNSPTWTCTSISNDSVLYPPDITTSHVTVELGDP
jgi:hypothetical protein